MTMIMRTYNAWLTFYRIIHLGLIAKFGATILTLMYVSMTLWLKFLSPLCKAVGEFVHLKTRKRLDSKSRKI